MQNQGLDFDPVKLKLIFHFTVSPLKNFWVSNL